MKENVELLKIQNPEFDHYLYDDDMCREFIKEHFDYDVLYTYDKLIPGAYKADLWRCCILYIYGGIYLDIKFHCINNFKLIELTDKEYFVKDLPNNIGNGIYQALLINLPKNKILLKTINKIVENCKNNFYGFSCLSVTGPNLMANFFPVKDFKENNFELQLKWYNKGKNICKIYKHNNPILEIYPEYRTEQKKNTQHYGYLFDEGKIYNYPIIKHIRYKNLSKNINLNINNKILYFYSSFPLVILLNNMYFINIQLINTNNTSLNLNINYEIESTLNISEKEICIDANTNIIQLFNHNNEKYYIKQINNDYINCDKINVNNNSCEFSQNKVSLTKIQQNKTKPQLFTYVNYHNDICIIYNWFPIQIGKVNKNTIENIQNIQKVPIIFQGVIWSTPGYIFNNEIWFVLNLKNNNHNNQHFIGIFDLEMNIKEYSEPFKLSNDNFEKCTGSIVTENELILTYILEQNEIYISVYIMDNIKNDLLWNNMDNIKRE